MLWLKDKIHAADIDKLKAAKKKLHDPSVQLKQMTAQGRIEALALAQELFALGDSAPGNRNTTVQGDS